ncbi:cell wall-binding repeat-containing protein [Herbiconiux sp. P18]|uniref:cell wall-binding repeat-containing protein n=1 Tax=Herbiconiux liangxiaofengii TaxID=3342795 RepID=UPI0035B7BCB9
MAASSGNWGAPVHHGVSGIQDCADVVVVGIRGSGQTADQNEGFGAEAAAVRDAVRVSIGDDRRVRQVQVDYQSLPVGAAAFLDVDLSAGEVSNLYLDSIASGVEYLEPVIDDSVQRCPDEKVVLIGYSQGALVAHRVAALYPDSSKFAGIVLVADPARTTASLTSLGNAPAGNGLTGWAGDLSSLPLDDVAPAVVSVCNADDLVCDTANLMTRIAATPVGGSGPSVGSGMTVHTSYVGGPLLARAGQMVADRILSVAVPATTTFDAPIGVDLSVKATVKRLATGVSATWRPDPDYTNPTGISLAADGTVTGRIAQQGDVSLKVQVRGSLGGWRTSFITLRAGAGQFCPGVGDLVNLTATPRTLDDIFVPGARAATSVLPAAGQGGVLANTVVTSGDSARRAPGASLDGQRLSSRDGLLVGVSVANEYRLLAFTKGRADPVRDLYDSPRFGGDGGWMSFQPTWLRGSLITAPTTDDAGKEVIVWETLDGSRGGQTAVKGTLLTGSARGWFESYRWPGSYGCVSDNSFVVREVDVTGGGEAVRRNVAAISATALGSREPMLAEADGSQSLGLLVGTYSSSKRQYGDARMLLWTEGTQTLRSIGSIRSEDAPGLVDGGGWLRDAWNYGYQRVGQVELAVTGSAASVHLPRQDRNTLENWQMDWAGNGVKSGVVYRFGVGETTRRWDAKAFSELITLPGATIFTGPDYPEPVVGRADGSTAKSVLGFRGNDNLATDGTAVIMRPGPNGPLTEPWVGTDELLSGFLYRVADPVVSPPQRLYDLPVVGGPANVYGVTLSDDSLTWTDDTVDAGAQWMTRVDPVAAGAAVTGGVTNMGAMVARMESWSQTPWVEGEWNLRVRDTAPGTELAAYRNGVEVWASDVSNDDQAYAIDDGLVVISSRCQVLKLETGQPVISAVVRARLGLDGFDCSWLAVEGDRVVWVDPESKVWTSSLTAATAQKRPLGEIDGWVRHLSVDEGRVLLVTESNSSSGEGPIQVLTTQVDDLARLTSLAHLGGAEAAIRSTQQNEGSLVQVSRSGSAFALSLGDGWTYDPSGPSYYGGYQRASVLVFGFGGAGPQAWITPPTEQYYSYGPVVSLNGSLLAWSDGVGGVVLSRLELRDEGTVTPTPTKPAVNRVMGADRYGVAVQVSQTAFPAGAPVVYLATGANYPDALSAGPAAVHEGGPLLLTPGDSLPAAVRTEIERLKPGKIVVVGGPASVSESVLLELTGIQKHTVRISGADRYEASRNLVRYAFGQVGAPAVYVATGANFPDALSAGAAGGAHAMPVLLVPGQSGSLDAATRQLLSDLGTARVIVAGGPNSVSPALYQALDEAVGDVQRLSGADRFEASVAINAQAFESADRVFLATGYNFPDALAGTAWAGSTASPLFVVPTDCVPPGVLAQIARLRAREVVLLGGPNSLSAAVASLTPCRT